MHICTLYIYILLPFFGSEGCQIGRSRYRTRRWGRSTVWVFYLSIFVVNKMISSTNESFQTKSPFEYRLFVYASADYSVFFTVFIQVSFSKIESLTFVHHRHQQSNRNDDWAFYRLLIINWLTDILTIKHN